MKFNRYLSFKTYLLAGLILFAILFLVWWSLDSKAYDADLEYWHRIESKQGGRA